MSSFFDEAYDNMTWEEVCYRLPGDLATRALIRRVTNLETIRMLFENAGSQPSNVVPLKEHLNEVLKNENADDIITTFCNEEFEGILFNWMDDENRVRIKDHNKDDLSMKFLFNATDEGDLDGMMTVLDRVLDKEEVNPSHLRKVLEKADTDVFGSMIDRILKDERPEVRVTILTVSGLDNRSLVSDFQRTIGLKALAKCTHPKPTKSMSVLSVDSFKALKPMERLKALERYLGYFPKYKKVNAFYPASTAEEIELFLFSGCIEHYDRVTEINKTYHEITEADPPLIKYGEEEQ